MPGLIGAAVILIGTLTPQVDARDHFLVLGGGYSPTGNQVSLERNVLFFRKMIAERFQEDTSVDLLFADGSSDNPDLQYMVSMDEIPKANLYMATLFGSPNNINLKYRDNSLEDVMGNSSEESVRQWIDSTGKNLTADDRLILYVTAHGGRSSDKENPFKTKIMLWDNKSIETVKLAELLTDIPSDVPIVMVMVQCFSGGFSHMIFDGADSSKGLAGRSICGFFSTINTRVAAGCTPEINEELYDEYSSHFWAAIRGKNRLDQDVSIPDYNGDGTISFDEAHAFTIIESDNIDIPVKTSDAWLRQNAPEMSESGNDLLEASSSYYLLLSHATVSQLAVLDSLSMELSLSGLDRFSASVEKAKSIEDQRKELAKKSRDLQRSIGSLRNNMRNDIRAKWPSLYNLLTPEAVALVTTKAPQFIEAVETSPHFEEFKTKSSDRKSIEDERAALESIWVKHQRFQRVLENIALRVNVENSGNPDLINPMNRIFAAESGSFSLLPLPREEVDPVVPPQPSVAETVPDQDISDSTALSSSEDTDPSESELLP